MEILSKSIMACSQLEQFAKGVARRHLHGSFQLAGVFTVMQHQLQE